jgi:hypothetical protein
VGSKSRLIAEYALIVIRYKAESAATIKRAGDLNGPNLDRPTTFKAPHSLEHADLAWADVVALSGMHPQSCHRRWCGGCSHGKYRRRYAIELGLVVGVGRLTATSGGGGAPPPGEQAGGDARRQRDGLCGGATEHERA